MFTHYKNNIKELLSYSENQFTVFSSAWERHFSVNITNERPPLIVSAPYMDHLLALFFVNKIRKDLEEISFNYELVFHTVVSFYICQDVSLSVLTPDSLLKLDKYFEDLLTQGLLQKKQKNEILSFLHKFLKNAYELEGCSLLKEFNLVNDLLYSTNPTVVLGRALMFYFGDPLKAYFKFRPEDKVLLSPSLFFDASFKNSSLIQDKFFKDLYIANLHFLMEVQAEKHILPF